MSDSVPSRSAPVGLPPWRSPLARALHRNRSRPYSRYFQLATVTPQGRPANRTVVFRGFALGQITFVTDQRSAKVADMAANPWGQACWYFTQTREQFRLTGLLELVTDTESAGDRQPVRHTTWQALSDNAKRQFYWPQPGAVRDLDAPLDITDAVDPQVPPKSFSLGLLQPTLVDHLELRGNPQNRTQYACLDDGTWHTTVINP
ncbi:MAG: pyridoxamine 5'-phosphate oxidase [Leptolyngbya sp. LCM1.Bin17]|nr:MAG: pyridoxamine 5'-phosphate oxidase [Leptolyngbya sp. LCM1.Bin17]